MIANAQLATCESSVCTHAEEVFIEDKSTRISSFCIYPHLSVVVKVLSEWVSGPSPCGVIVPDTFPDVTRHTWVRDHVTGGNLILEDIEAHTGPNDDQQRKEGTQLQIILIFCKQSTHCYQRIAYLCLHCFIENIS